MPQVACSRCFKVFEAREVRPGLPPTCPRCAVEAPALTPLPMPAVSPAPRHTPAPRAGAPRAASAQPAARRTPRRSGRGGGRRAAIAAAVVLAAGAGAAALLLRRPAPPAPAGPTPVEALVQDWRAQGVVEAPPPGAARRTLADAGVAAGRAALAEDLPSRSAAAAAAFRDALAADPHRLDAVAGWAIAFAETAGDAPDGESLQVAHEVVRFGLEAEPGRPDLLAAYARLLLLVPSAANDAEALASAERAAAAAPADADARLALGLARLGSDPAAAARELEAAMVDSPRDRRLPSAAARARWRAGDAVGAAALASRRLAGDRGHGASLALLAEIEVASRRLGQARVLLARWAAAAPRDARPHLELAKIAYQVEGNAGAARRRLRAALPLATDDHFLSALLLSHLAAVERAAGDAPAARAAVADALARVPASGPARFQAALLAFDRGDAAGLRESAGVLGLRAGPLAAQLLAARSAELSATTDDALEAYRRVADLAPRDPAVILSAGGAAARLGASGPALALAERALRRDPLEGRLRLAVTDYWEGPAALAEAGRRYADIARAEPSAAATALSAAAVCELLLGHTAAAQDLAARAALASPQRALPAALEAQVAIERGQARRALDLVRTALEADPLDPVVLVVRARALEAVGRRLEALRAHRDALESGPDLATARLALARLLARGGSPDEAQAALAALVRDDPEVGEARGALLDLARPAAAPAAR
jgi:Tfp pilus assembly protein PilF